jgi:hypothetical protein
MDAAPSRRGVFAFDANGDERLSVVRSGFDAILREWLHEDRHRHRKPSYDDKTDVLGLMIKTHATATRGLSRTAPRWMCPAHAA